MKKPDPIYELIPIAVEVRQRCNKIEVEFFNRLGCVAEGNIYKDELITICRKWIYQEKKYSREGKSDKDVTMLKRISSKLEDVHKVLEKERSTLFSDVMDYADISRKGLRKSPNEQKIEFYKFIDDMGSYINIFRSCAEGVSGDIQRKLPTIRQTWFIQELAKYYLLITGKYPVIPGDIKIQRDQLCEEPFGYLLTGILEINTVRFSSEVALAQLARKVIKGLKQQRPTR